MSIRDLRGWIKEAEALGEVKTIKGADWNTEIGAIENELAKRRGG